MNVKLKVLRKVLEEAIANIDAGNSNHSDDELDDIISSLTKLNRGIKRISKREACERILHCSPSSNAQYHDYIRLYSEWFRNINKNELDNKIIESAITFYFKDEDSGSTKTWNYFKTAN